jgi:hypothetical protein
LLVVGEQKPNHGGKEPLSTEVVVALISVFGVVLTALIGNWDKIFRASPDSDKPGFTPTRSSESIPRDKKVRKSHRKDTWRVLGNICQFRTIKVLIRRQGGSCFLAQVGLKPDGLIKEEQIS